MASEFQLIQKHFIDPHTVNRPEIVLGSGDDCAILDIPDGFQLAISTDTLVGGLHFLESWAPEDIGHKILAVNLSDLAAMGAKALGVSVAATFPKGVSEEWIAGLAKGFFNLAHRYDVQCIGGDLTSGPLSFTVNVYGLLPKGKALKRSGVKVGDLVCVSGDLGDAAAALLYPNEYLEKKLRYPEPRLELGAQLLEHASAACDISDGLAQDLSHILKASNVGAVLDRRQLPVSDTLVEIAGAQRAQQFALESGDAYELCFTISPAAHAALNLGHVIGEVVERPGLFEQTDSGLKEILAKGFQHF